MAEKISLQDEEIVTLLKPDLDAAQLHQDDLAMQREAYYKSFRMALYGNEREGWSKSVASTVYTQHQSVLAALMEIFSGEFFTLKGRDSDKATKNQKLIAYQLFRKNDGNKKIYDFLFNAGLYHYAVFKVYHKEDYELVDEKYDRLDGNQMVMLSQDPKRQITKYDEVTLAGPVDMMSGLPTEVTVFENVKVVRKDIKYFGPTFEVVQPWAFGYSQDCKITEWGGIDGRLVYHSVKLSLNDIRRREKAGIYKKGTFAKCKDLSSSTAVTKTDEASIELQVDGLTEIIDDGSRYRKGNEPDLNRELSVKECYVKLDIDKDGLLEPCIVTIIEDTVVAQVEENPYGRPVFRIGSMLPEPHKVHGIAPPSILEHDQKIQTNLLRFIQDSAAQSCYRNPVTNDVRMQQMLQERKPFDVILGDPARLGEVKTSPPDNFVLKAFELLQGTNEEKTGNSRYNQGSDSESLNKMLDIETMIPMADGSYKLLKDVVDGDRILGSNGKAVTVLKAHEIHYPERAYDIKFRSGEVIKAGGEHLWTIQTPHDIQNGKNRTVDTDTIFKLMSDRPKRPIYIPRVLRPDFENSSELPLDPYILGVWLGDGHTYAPRITTQDEELIASVRAWAEKVGGEVVVDKHQLAGKATTYYIRGLYPYLRGMDLLNRGKEKFAKHIPEAYLKASYADRLELLRGIMDTDGCHHTGPTAVFVQKGGRLFDDVMQLIESLGGWPCISRTYPGALERKGAKYYQVAFSIFDNPFRLSSKADKWTPPTKRIDRQNIVSIKETPITLMRCLTVDADDGLFCCGTKFTLTHNTATGISLISQASARRTRMSAKAIGNGAVTGLIRDFIFINQKWPNPDPVYLLGENLTINPDDVMGEYEIEIDIGVSPAEKQAIANQIDLLLQFATQAGLQMGIQKPEHIIRGIKKKFAQLNIVVDDLLVSEPEYKQMEMQKQQEAQQNPPPPPPEVQAQQLEMQMSQQEHEMKMAELQAKVQAEQQKLQLELQQAQLEAELEQEKMKAELAKISLTMQQTREQHALKMREMERQEEASRSKAAERDADPLKLRGKK